MIVRHMPRSTKPLGISHPREDRFEPTPPRRQLHPALRAVASHADRRPVRSFLFVDLGYGFDPRTTLESAERFRRANPGPEDPRR
ncbi:MAG: hypothetical protein M0C28_35115 [Candidatus Moduliflexus flocculans]|nr:hypothetical protein [Candidatus Moduliflexus flocculans]